MKLHELREKRAQAVAKMRSLTDKAEAETRDLFQRPLRPEGRTHSEVLLASSFRRLAFWLYTQFR